MKTCAEVEATVVGPGLGVGARSARLVGVLATAVAMLLVAVAPAAAKGGEIGGSGSDYLLNDDWAGPANHSLVYGGASDHAFIGDWDADGSDSLAVRIGRVMHLRDVLTSGPAERTVVFGREGDVVLVGDWDGDGRDTLAVRRGRTYYLSNTLAGGTAEQVLVFGREGDVVLVGDWDGDGRDTLAVRRGRTYYLSNTLAGGTAEQVLVFGREGDVVLVGDWDGDGRDTLAVRRGRTYYLSNTLAGGTADLVTVYGRETDTAFAGDWNADGVTTLGVRRPPPPPTRPPFFVYGSLRTGQSGYYLLAGKTVSEDLTRTPGLDMYRLSGSSYPFAVPNSANASGIVGQEMAIRLDLYDGVLASLDRYERYDPTAPPDNQTYVRELRPTAEGINSWVYVAGPRMAQYLRSSGILISSGDYLRW